MKAMIYKKYGPPEVLQPAEVEQPQPADNEILVKIKAVEATKSDCEMRAFRFPVKWFWLPLRLVLGIFRPRRQILGSYFAGEVAATGKDVTKFQTGQAVFGAARIRLGCYAEYNTLPETYTIVLKPDNISFEEAAAVGLGGLNAIHFMRKADIQAGETVLINGAGGSIGTFAVQLAKNKGAYVTAVDSNIKLDMLKSIGADEVVDYQKEDFAKNGLQYDVILDMVAKKNYSARIRSLKPGGRFLTANPRLTDALRSKFTNAFTKKKALMALAGETLEELQALSDMLAAGQIKSQVGKVLPLEQAAEAHRMVEQETRLGPVVLQIG